MNKLQFRYVIGPIVGLAVIISLFTTGRLQDAGEDVFENAAPKHIVESSKIKFEDITHNAGINFYHGYYHPHERRNENLRVLSTMFPAVSVADVDGDGYMDMYISAGTVHESNLLYRNNGDGTFTDISAKLGVSRLNHNKSGPSSFSVFADFNKDGHLDLFVAKWGCHQLFYGQGKDQPFKEVSEKLNGYCSNPNGIGVADMNKDGLLDIVFGNFIPPVNLLVEGYEHWSIGVRGDKKNGGKDEILFQKPDGTFDVENKVTFPYASFTHAIGLTDLNIDGYPDILFANDHASDEMYMNMQNKEFKEVTGRFIPVRKHGFTSMNSEFHDFDRDGWPDIYITNAYKPPFQRSNNVLWKRTPRGGFEELSWDYGVARCGYSWGAKFADFDLDGEDDLMVLNGRVQGLDVKDRKGNYSFWYERFQTSEVPLFLRKTYTATFPQHVGSNFYMSAFERSCLFQQKDGVFYDVATNAGLTDLYNGRGLATIDIDNDGRMDLAIVNVGGPALLYRNVSPPQGEWIGFDLNGGNGWRIPFGARLELERAQDQAPIVREIFPTNGMKAQSDPRINIGLGPHPKIGNVTVTWPDGVREVFVHFEKNKYNPLIRGQGVSPGDRSPSQEH